MIDPSWQQLTATVAELPELMRRFTDRALRRAPATAAVGVETFSAIGHLCHLRDIEIDGYHQRIRRLRAEEQPFLPSLSGEQLAVERGYAAADRERALAEFLAARQRSLLLIESIAVAEWPRTGTFEGHGPISLRDLVDIMCAHDAGHLQALRALATA
jgi:hypothetical protein